MRQAWFCSRLGLLLPLVFFLTFWRHTVRSRSWLGPSKRWPRRQHYCELTSLCWKLSSWKREKMSRFDTIRKSEVTSSSVRRRRDPFCIQEKKFKAKGLPFISLESPFWIFPVCPTVVLIFLRYWKSGKRTRLPSSCLWLYFLNSGCPRPVCNEPENCLGLTPDNCNEIAISVSIRLQLQSGYSH